MKRKHKTRLLVWMLAFAIICTGVAPALALYEGEGFASPEDAAIAYLHGMRDQDLTEMMAVFAIETYVQNYDFTAQLQRMGAYIPAMDIKLPNATPMLQEANIEARKSSIAGVAINQCLVISAVDVDISVPQYFGDTDRDAQAEAFVKEMETGLQQVAWEKLEVIGAVSPQKLSEMYALEKNQENLSQSAQRIGAEEVQSVAVLFAIDRQSYLLCADAVCYGGAWYLLQMNGNIGALLSLAVYTGGVAPLSLLEVLKVGEALIVP